MSNTQQRIISALVLVIIVGLCFWHSVTATSIFLAVIGISMCDEFSCNFLGLKRFGPKYLVNLLSFSSLYFVTGFFKPELVSYNWVWPLLGMNTLFLYYLFFYPIDSDGVVAKLKSLSFIFGLIIYVSLISLLILLRENDWRISLVLLLLVNFGMDTGAWLFGKLFGKHKLWEAVSPKKTIEGLIGGVICSGSLGYVVYGNVNSNWNLKFFALFAFLGLISQVGDLFQSKLKRQFGIKDSSSLIPGHGGVYDRVDSLIFMAPYYVVFLG